MKLPLLEAIMGTETLDSYCLDVADGLKFFAETAEVIDVALAEQFFGILCKAWNRSESDWPGLCYRSERLVKLLPPVPWRKNSQSALVWLEKLITCRFVYGPAWEAVEQSIPNGIFTDAERAYLSQHKRAGDFSWGAFLVAFSDGSAGQADSL
jgi:hypothetical protein